MFTKDTTLIIPTRNRINLLKNNKAVDLCKDFLPDSISKRIDLINATNKQNYIPKIIVLKLLIE